MKPRPAEIYILRQKLKEIGDPRKEKYKRTFDRLQRLVTAQLKSEIRQERRAS